MKMLHNLRARLVLAAALLILTLGCAAFGQITPSDDAYVNSSKSTTNFGTATTLNLQSAADTSYILFDLTAVPAGYTGASITKATLKLYVNSVTTAGSFNVDYVNGSWAEKTITYSLQPAIGTTIASGVPLTTTSAGKYVEIDVTAAMVEWLNGAQPNDGIALVANSPLVATFDSKENTGASHPPEIDIVYAGIAGVSTASGSGLTGGGTSGTLNLALTNSCSNNQVLQWNGSSWACATVGTGTVTSVGLSGPASDFKVSGLPITGTGTLNFAWNVAPTNANVGNAIVKRDAGGNFVAQGIVAATVSTGGLFSQVAAPNTALVFAQNTSTIGSGSYGVYGETDSNDYGATGVFGYSSARTNGMGILGIDVSPSNTGAGRQRGYGVWGDTGADGNWAIVGTADNGTAGYFENNSPFNVSTLMAVSDNAAAGPFYAFNVATGNLGCNIDASGNLNCSGAKHAVVPIDGGQRKVALSAIESPKNWFEDFGSGQLVNGAAVVTLDADFIQTVNTDMEYNVFLTPYGDCKGLYVTNRTRTTFEVHELGGGTAAVNYGYRIVALRKNFENIRLEDHTKDPDPAKILEARKKGAPAKADTNLAPKTHTIAQKAVR